MVENGVCSRHLIQVRSAAAAVCIALLVVAASAQPAGAEPGTLKTGEVAPIASPSYGSGAAYQVQADRPSTDPLALTLDTYRSSLRVPGYFACPTYAAPSPSKVGERSPRNDTSWESGFDLSKAPSYSDAATKPSAQNTCNPAPVYLINWSIRGGTEAGSVSLVTYSAFRGSYYDAARPLTNLANLATTSRTVDTRTVTPGEVNSFNVQIEVSRSTDDALVEDAAVGLLQDGPGPALSYPSAGKTILVGDLGRGGGSLALPTVRSGERLNLRLEYDIDSDRDGIIDSRDSDSDGDNVLDNSDNCLYRANPDQRDRDRNGKGAVCDVHERWFYWRENADQDQDKIRDLDEINKYKTDPLDLDTDDDGLSDTREISRSKTNPVRWDTDFDGVSDGVELGLIRVPYREPVPQSDGRKNDKCPVQRESANSTYLSAKSTKTALAPSPNKGLGSGYFYRQDPLVCGSSSAFLRLDSDPRTNTAPSRRDTDKDGLRDGLEDLNGNGRVDRGETNPKRRDSDGDGVRDRRDNPTRR